jgi:hypothetical protein
MTITNQMKRLIQIIITRQITTIMMKKAKRILSMKIAMIFCLIPKIKTQLLMNKVIMIKLKITDIVITSMKVMLIKMIV